MYRILVIVFVFVFGVTGEYKFTYQMAQRCKEHICTHGYRYEIYYRTDDAKYLSHTNKEHDSLFEMHIAVQASSNGHILLSPVSNPSPLDDVYEIVIGGGGNRFTELRRNLRRNAKISVKTPNILSTIELRAFHIKISQDGLIEFRKEGESIPLLSFYDVDPLQIKYFSFAAWSGVEAKFLYDCPTSEDLAEPVTGSQPVEPRLSNSDDLKRTLLMGRLPSVPPSQNITVKLRILVTHITYDPFESMLTTRMAVIMSWTDDSMAWNPSKFNGTSSIKLRLGQIWRPTLYVFNSNDIAAFDTENPDMITMVNSGEATFHFQTKVTSLCAMQEAEIKKWPRDAYQCSIVIQPWEAHENITLEIMPIDDRKVQAYADVDEMVNSEWEFVMTDVVIKNEIWNLVFESNDNRTHQSDRYIMQFDLIRRPSAYDLAFHSPLIALTIFVLMSFWSEPLKMSRVWFYSGCTVIMCMGLCYIEYLVPVYSVPNILIFYTTILGGVLLALIIQVILLSSTTDRLCETLLIKSFIFSTLCRTVFCLPPIKTSVNGGYMVQEDDDSGCMVAHSENVEEMESDDSKRHGNKAEFAIIIDKFMFFVYSVTTAALLVAHY